MLEIDMEFRKGILFVRLIGVLTKETVPVLNKEVTEIVKEYGIHNVVFNLRELKEIDTAGIQALLKYEQLSKKMSGETVICGVVEPDLRRQMKQQKVFQHLYETSDELTAFQTFQRFDIY